MTRYMIIDDEYIAHEIIQGYCDLLPNMELQKNCYDGIEALEFLKQNTVDLIFLDLNMPKLKGYDFLRILQNPPKVIITTAYKEHALESYEFDVSDYLLKPFSFERFLKAVNKATSETSGQNTSKSPAAKESSKTIFIKSSNRHLKIKVDDILFIEASGNYTKIMLKDESHSIRNKFSEFLSSLPASDFVQVHKSFAIATEHIVSIEGSRINMGLEMIPIGKMYKMKVNEILNKPS